MRMAPCASLYALHYLYFRPEIRQIRQIRWCTGDDDDYNADDDDRDNVDDDHDDDHDDDGRLTLGLSSFLPSSPITASQSPIGWTSTFTSHTSC